MSLRACARDLNQPRCAHTVSAGGTGRKRQTKKVAFLLVFPIIRLNTGGFPSSHDHAARFSAVHVNLMQTGTGGAGNVRGYFLSGCAVRPLRVLCVSADGMRISAARKRSRYERNRDRNTALTCSVCPLPLS